ncbi:MAG: Flp pilus assembly complex ATPase component TadA [Candidatus Omnitrophica bacterium]|nr:Flp pilus assembly complex ATPase component TadA [Candidatus Omnitrophota bacterium]
MKNLSERVIEVLKKSKRLSEEDLQKALMVYAKEGRGKLRDVLVHLGLITEKELLSLLSEELKVPFLNLAKYKVNQELAKLIPEKLARKHQIIPISKIGGTLTIAVSDPLNVVAVDDISLFTKHKIECVVSPEKDIRDALDKLYISEHDSMSEVMKSIAGDDVTLMKDEEDGDVHAAGGKETDAPVVRIVDLLLREAFKRRASDIHIEPFENIVRVRYRVDGGLEQVLTIPKKNQNAVLTRLKILSKLDITENRIPQDGRFKTRLHDKEVDFRVSILPVYYGNKVVMRLLDKSAISVGLDNLGFSQDSLRDLKTAISKPFGMILITGPTGSGKSTTLYSILNQLNTPEKNIITIEDPIEYQVRGITQIQTKSEIGLTFASGLRAVLRQSPDIVMVGEIRDAETADIAIKASLTGQLVLSTLHTNDAAGAMTRLMDMHVEPFLIASSVILVAAQRLCRKLCQFCREKTDIPKEVFERMKMDLKAGVYYKPRGCDKCNQSGYKGRMGILETLLVDDTMRDMVIRRASSYEIKDYAVKNGMLTLYQDAMRKFREGLTSLDEIVRVTTGDE